MKISKHLMVAMLLAIILVVAAGCGNSSNNTPSPSPTVTNSDMSSMDPGMKMDDTSK
ncbi:hypothetical protein [Cohnella massiliensis]|uniref:hypothetical protein n=1 Tax=Cohnella massiliensis TaxID=1816691 RepID=UPI001592CFA4|nr:hypothetical protein [Cohnella massiliensis]